jgi:hypothetical protein
MSHETRFAANRRLLLGCFLLMQTSAHCGLWIADCGLNGRAAVRDPQTDNTNPQSPILNPQSEDSQSAVGDETATAEMLRHWLAGQPQGVPAMRTSDPNLDRWRTYILLSAQRDAASRERQLRALYGATDSPLLRSVVLQAINEDPEFQSRQARFIRRYGFYATWFNRLTYTAGRMVQGNVQAAAQLLVDGLDDLFAPGEASPADRRAYDLLNRTAAARGPGAVDPDELVRLRERVEGAWADDDRAHAAWLLEEGSPETAIFHARQALLRRPDDGGAGRLVDGAEREMARRRRETLASLQVGYPDRAPSFESSDAELLRSIQHRSPQVLAALAPLGGPVLTALGRLPPPGEGIGETLFDRSDGLEASGAEGRWLDALADSPEQNPRARLDRARAARRGALWRYVILGPERPRERAYQTASLAVQSVDALRDIGFFYVFEVLTRAGTAIVRTPAPEEAVVDAEAAWLAQAPDPRGPLAQAVARDLAQTAVRRGHEDAARRVLADHGASDTKTLRAIDRAEAERRLADAESLPDGPQRRAQLDEVVRLLPGSALARRADALRRAPPVPAATDEWQVDWATLRAWEQAARSDARVGLVPGDAAWFDGDPRNGEVSGEGPIFTVGDEPGALEVRFAVQVPGERRIHQAGVPADRWPPAARRWLDLVRRQARQAEDVRHQYDRLSIPFTLEGGAGPSGVDVYPRLLPLEGRPGETTLYR